jgi:hypothetical protein
MHGRIAAVKQTSVRYEERASQCWLWKESPCKWQGKVELQFTSVPLRQLEPAGSWTKPATVSKWLRHLNTGRHIPPPVVCATERGTLYIRDGNHRYEALLQFFGGNRDARVRVALVVPKRGYEFAGVHVRTEQLTKPSDVSKRRQKNERMQCRSRGLNTITKKKRANNSSST